MASWITQGYKRELDDYARHSNELLGSPWPAKPTAKRRPSQPAKAQNTTSTDLLGWVALPEFQNILDDLASGRKSASDLGKIVAALKNLSIQGVAPSSEKLAEVLSAI